MKFRYFLIFFVLFNYILFAELKFEPLAIDKNNNSLFGSNEIIANKLYNKTLFYSFFEKEKIKFFEATFYPEKIFYSQTKNRLYIQNRMGLYFYDFKNESVNSIDIYPNFKNKDEYVIYKLSETGFSPDYKYALGKTAKSNVKASIYLYDLENNKVEEIITDVEILPGVSAGYWAYDSNYFIYQKNGNIYYFSIIDYKRNKLLQEDWRKIGKGKISSARWTEDNHLIWVEDNYIYKADSRQFFSRSIYNKYLRQGNVIGKIPFKFDPSFDSFRYNNFSNKFILVQNYKSIFYYSINDDLLSVPYLKLNDKLSFEEAYLFDNGEGILLLNELSKGKLIKKIFLLKKDKNIYFFKPFNPENIKEQTINSLSISMDNKDFLINSSSGAYCFNFESLNLIWNFEEEQVVSSINTGAGEWILGGIYRTIKAVPSVNSFTPIFASSYNDAGFFKYDAAMNCSNKNYIFDKTKKTIKEYTGGDFKLNKNPANETYRLISREVKKGFYYESIYLKELYSGILNPIIGEQKLSYELYQPEIKIGIEYYNNPNPEKYEIALVFDCVKSSEGVFPILTSLNDFKIKSTFFINGVFMEINPDMVKEIVNFDIEFGNMFQYYVNLNDSNFLMDKNFIRQGLSANEERFFKLTEKNFSPIWHSPMYAYNESIVKFGAAGGYKFVTFNLDSLDWVGKNNNELTDDLYMSSSLIIKRILENIKPGQIIVFSVGKNNSDREDWLFDNFDLLISELVRAGYSFTTVSDLMKKYKEAKTDQ